MFIATQSKAENTEVSIKGQKDKYSVVYLPNEIFVGCTKN